MNTMSYALATVLGRCPLHGAPGRRMTSLGVVNVRKSYSAAEVTRGVSVSIAEGE